jgi:hypothetical protein
VIAFRPHVGVLYATRVTQWLEEVRLGEQVSEADALVVDAIKETYGSFTIGALFETYKHWDDVNKLREFMRQAFVTNVPSPNSSIGHALSLTLALSLISAYVKVEEKVSKIIIFVYTSVSYLAFVHSYRLKVQDIPYLARYNDEFKKVSRNYTPTMKTNSGFVPWVDNKNECETLLTQYEVETHGATTPYNCMTLFEKDNNVYGRCALCVTDVSMSQSQRVKRNEINRSSMLNVAQHACSKGHQASKLAYLRGIRDCLKHIAHNSLRDDTYQKVVNDCHRLEQNLRNLLKDTPANAPSMASEGGPTPDTNKRLCSTFTTM